TDRKINNDTVRMEAFGLNAGLKSAGCNGNSERFLRRKFPSQVLDQDLILSHDQHLGHRLVFEVAQGHAMFLQELDQVLARDTTVLGTGDAVALQPARVEPLADSARGHFADLCDLTSCEDLHYRFSIAPR